MKTYWVELKLNISSLRANMSPLKPRPYEFRTIFGKWLLTLWSQGGSQCTNVPAHHESTPTTTHRQHRTTHFFQFLLKPVTSYSHYCHQKSALFPLRARELTHMTYGTVITWHHRSSWRTRPCGWSNESLGASTASQHIKTVFKLNELKRPFTSFHQLPPTTAWSSRTMQVISKCLNTQNPSVLVGKTTWGKWEQRSAHGTYEALFHTVVTSLETPVFAVGVNGSTRGHDLTFNMMSSFSVGQDYKDKVYSQTRSVVCNPYVGFVLFTAQRPLQTKRGVFFF